MNNRIRLKDKAATRLFKRGEPMWSDDGGVTWNRGEPPKPRPGGSVGVVTKVDHQQGVITIGLAADATTKGPSQAPAVYPVAGRGQGSRRS